MRGLLRCEVERPRRYKKRLEFLEWVEKQDRNKLIYLDESGANFAMTRRYGRIEGGQRLVLANPYSRGQNHSIISAVRETEIITALYSEGSVDGELFLHFMETYLGPKLKAGDFVIMDNIAFHKVKRVETIVNRYGAEVVYLPPYSPDLSPIELMWSKIKTLLRKYSPRCADTFKIAMKTSFEAVQAADLQGWFRHCVPIGSNIFKML